MPSWPPMLRAVCRSLTGSACRTVDFVSMCRPHTAANLDDLDRLYDAVRPHNRQIDTMFANVGVARLAPSRAHE